MADNTNNAGEPPVSMMEAAEILLSLSSTSLQAQIQSVEAGAARLGRPELRDALLNDNIPHLASLANFRSTDGLRVATGNAAAPGEITPAIARAPHNTPGQLHGGPSSHTDRQQDRPHITHWVCPVCHLLRNNNTRVTYSDGTTLTAHITTDHANLLPDDPRRRIKLFADFRRILLERQPGFGR